MEPKLHIEIHDDPSDYWALASDWNDILARMNETNPFLTPQWVGLSNEYFGGSSICALISARHGKDLVGIAPLRIEETQGVPVLRFAVDELLTDYADMVLLPKFRTRALRDILKAITQLMETTFGHMNLFLGPMRWDSPTVLLLEKQTGGKLVQSRPHTFIKLPSTVSEFHYRTLKSANRKLLSQKEDRITREHQVEIEVFQTPLDIAENLDDFMWLFSSENPDKQSFMTPAREAFIREVLPIMARSNTCKLYYIKLDGTRVGAHVVFELGSSVLVYLSAEGSQSIRLSPGVLLLKSIIENAIERGMSTVDLGQGDEKYKLQLGAKRGKVMGVVSGDVPESLFQISKPNNSMIL